MKFNKDNNGLLEILSADAIDRELEAVSKIEDIEAGAQQAPLNSLTDQGFELLLWELSRKRTQHQEYYDKATLMVVGADQGRDVWLTLNGKPAGLIQCKRLKSSFSAPETLREIIKFILFADLFPDLLCDGLPFKYSLAVSSDPTGTTVDFFTSPAQWLEKNDDRILGFLEEVIENYESFKGFTGADKLDLVKQRLHAFSYELLRPADIDMLLHELPRVRARFFRHRLVQSEEAFDELFDRKVREHGLGQQPSGKARQLLDDEVQSETETLRKSRFFPGSNVVKSALEMIAKLRSGEFAQASDQVRAEALGACARWLSRSENREVVETAIKDSEELGVSQGAAIAKANLAGLSNWREGLRVLAPLESPVRVTAAFLMVLHEKNAKEALKWLKNANFVADDFDLDGKVVLLGCMLEAQDWEGALNFVKSLTDSDFVKAPALFNLAGIAHLSSVVPQDFRRLIGSSVLFARGQVPMWDDNASIEIRRTAINLFRKAGDAAKEYGLEIQHTYESQALWVELHDPDHKQSAQDRLTSFLNDQKTAFHYVPLGLGFELKVDREKVEEVLTSQEARNPGGSFEVALCRFVMANSIEEPKSALAYFVTHRDLLEVHLNADFVLEFEVRACIQAGMIEPAKDALGRKSPKVTSHQRQRLEKVIEQGATGPDLEDLEREYTETSTTVALANLVHRLGQQGYSERFFVLARKLIDETRSIEETERVVRLLTANERDQEVEIVLSDAADLIELSDDLRGAKAWLQFRNGDFGGAFAAIRQLRVDRDVQSDRILYQNLLIASGRWEELSAFVESEWQSREERAADELFVVARLAGAIDSPRLSDFLQAAATAGEDNPDILLGCYMTATECGIEEGEEVFKWFEKAAELSGEDGPVQSFSIDEVVKLQPEWNERSAEVWKSYMSGEMPLSLVAAQLRRSSLEMQISSFVANQKQADPRRRSVISAFSGTRGATNLDVRTVALDSTALVTLASVGFLDDVVQHYEEVHIPHSTFSWLFAERQKLAFHQPSRVKSARSLLTALTTKKVFEFVAPMAPDAELATLVDFELAEMLTSANADEGDDQIVVVRSAPVHKIGSLMDAAVDLSHYQACLASCQAVVDKLAEVGFLLEDEENRARAFLSRQEKRWTVEPKIEDGAHLLLDDLSVSYLQSTNLLKSLSDVGFKVFVPPSAVREANALVELADNSEEFGRIIERMRKVLCDGISSGKVRVDRVFGDEEHTAHPNVAVLQLAGSVEGIVSDDRYLNQYQHAGEDGYQTPVLTSLDILAGLSRKNSISQVKLKNVRSTLRRAGYMLFPTSREELLQLVDTAQIKDAALVETADLKAFRENILCCQMRRFLVLPKEAYWFEQFRKDIISVLVSQWKKEVPDEKARARSRWMMGLLDIRNWADSVTENDGSGLAEFGWGIICNSLALAHLDIQDDASADRYSDWLQDEVFDDLRTEDPFVHEWLIRTLKEMLLSRHLVEGGSND
ncbi:hypothetical protein D1821_03275 [Phaeobacter inhibens]|uniref:HTH domain-containing protein n=1 Tax=Phaeobacter inhibens TaxID=221822 RepID=UPI000160F4F5|nr:hypothetical protein [Phaeobacter inhibens]AFO86661.1 hypothetical protein PGA2_c06440 [Phaeobacter inhibens 2.10]AXT41474.1 hypothetical protein D1821_03275 [Phaeobacter inhibens]